MPAQSLTTLYDEAAPVWGKRVADIGYLAAYRGFVHLTLPKQSCELTVCDIGTGCGTFAMAALDAGVSVSNVTLIDPSKKMLNHARQALTSRVPTIKVYQTQLETFQSKQLFDVILCAHVIEHCANPTDAIAKMSNLLAPGGTLLLVISRPHWCQWLIWLHWRHRWFSQDQVRQMARAARLPDPICHRFTAGPPKRTSFGYVFARPIERTPTC